MTLAEELRRERAAARAAAGVGDVRQRRGIDQLDSLDQLDLLDWETDPWDEATEAGHVERLRVQTRSLKWLAFTALILLNALVLLAGAVGWWYIGRINPAGEASAPASFTVGADDTVESISERLEDGGWITDGAVFRFYVDRHGGLELTPGYYEIPRDDLSVENT